MSSVLPAVFSGLAFLVALRSLPALHPFQVWSGSWAVATTLFALRLLPYRHLSWLTAALICGAVITFAAGAPLGEWIARRRRVRQPLQRDARIVAIAASLSVALLAVTLAAFLGQLVSRYGAGRVFRISPEVKLYLSSGEAPVSGTYVQVAIAAAASCGLSAALARARARLLWVFGAVACAGTVYFSTSRGFIVIALVAGLTPLALVRAVAGRWLLAGTATAMLITIAIFIGLGSVLGKTYGNSTIGQFDNFFSRHSALRSLALPYQDTTAGISALDLLVDASPTWGVAYGCATAPIPCGIIRKLGAPAVRVPVAGPFTKAPLRWNAYTFLDRFLIDGGTALALLLVAITGAVAGFLWARARAGSALGIVLYAIALPGLVAAYRQNLIELLAIAAVIAAGMWALARVLSRFRAILGGAPARAAR